MPYRGTRLVKKTFTIVTMMLALLAQAHAQSDAISGYGNTQLRPSIANPVQGDVLTFINGNWVNRASAAYTESSTAEGTAYSLTTTLDTLKYGTTRPAITLQQAGTYLILLRNRTSFVGATFSANDTTVIVLRRVNNDPTDIDSVMAITPIITTMTQHFADQTIPLIYSTVNANDVLQVWGKIYTAPEAGSVRVVGTNLVAVKLY